MRLGGLKDLPTAEGSTERRAEPHSAIYGGAIAPLAPPVPPPLGSTTLVCLHRVRGLATQECVLYTLLA